MASEKPVALVTGANKGIGLEIARQLGQKGFIVAVGSRDPLKGEVAAAALRGEGIEASAVKLDVASDADIAALPAFFQAPYGRLDVLVNNAGVYLDQTGTTPDVLRKTFETNTIAPYAIIDVLLPLLKASPAGRIVNQSSIIGSLAALSGKASPEFALSNEWLAPAYAASKAALNALTIVYSRQLADTKVKINSAHPGWVKTEMGGDAAPLSPAEGAKTAVTLATLPDDGPSGGFFHDGESLPW